MQSTALNKSIIRDFYRRAIAGGDLDFANQIIANDYQNHSPMVKPGKAGLLEALNYLKQLPKPTTTAQPFMRLLAEGDYVVTNLSFELGGKPKAVVDLFRLRNGQLVEHWDATEDQPATSRNGNPMMDGPTESEDPDDTARNKSIVSEFFHAVFVDRNLDRLPNFVATDLVQHHPKIANGIDGLRQSLQEKTADFKVRNVLQIIGEGNFVVVHSEGTYDQKPSLSFDIFRLSNGKIVEHWSVRQVD